MNEWGMGKWGPGTEKSCGYEIYGSVAGDLVGLKTILLAVCTEKSYLLYLLTA